MFKFSKNNPRFFSGLAPGCCLGVFTFVDESRGCFKEVRHSGNENRRTWHAHEQGRSALWVVGQNRNRSPVIFDLARKGARPVR